ncbi:hypothetical protein C7N43_21280 [Sphingobacteriales bacterium UPWRP_1]|nr:hypothetical protein BVG80_16155 [Sphingobacteriales bacterium TSM_CSM]PSJ75006.1 hypothetical protein C7N43_21280 [Sphingobacteriales bacterium UPWRP_1]
METEKIIFRKVRNMSETLSAASVFIRQNIILLSKGIGFIAMPFFLTGLVGYYLVLALVIESSSNFSQGFEAMGISYLFSLLVMLGAVVLLAVIYELLVLYIKRPDFTEITVKELAGQVYKNLGIYLSTTFFLYVLLVIAVFGLVFALVAGMAFIFGLADLNPVLGVLGSLGLLMLLTYPFVALSFIYIVRLVERKGFIDSVKRCFQLIRGNWLSTLWLYTVTLLVSFSITGLIPTFITGGAIFLIDMFSWDEAVFLLPVLGLLYTVVTVIINVVAMVVIALRYFSIVEQTEGIGLIRKIDLIGSFTPTPPAVN